MIACRQFLLCENEAVGLARHPILGDVPACQRCADRLELELAPLDEGMTLEEAQAEARAMIAEARARREEEDRAEARAERRHERRVS